MRKSRIKIVCLAGSVLMLLGCQNSDVQKKDVTLTGSGAENEVSVDIYGTSDLHGVFDTWNYEKNEEQTDGSLAQISTFIWQKRAENPDLLLLDTGDSMVGNEASLYKDDVRTPMIAAFEYLEYDTWTYGNHEFNYGPDYAKKWREEFSSVDVLCANVYTDEGEQLGQSYVVKEVSGVKIAIIGLTTTKILEYDGDKLQGWEVADPAERCRQVIDEIEENEAADIYVLAAHIGVEEEDREGDDICDVIEACPELDAVFAGHSHEVIARAEGNTLLMMPGCKGQWVSHANFQVKRDENGAWYVDEATCEVISMENVEADPLFSKVFWEYHIRGVQAASGESGT